MIYVTKDGDQLDAVCFEQYGTSAAAETVLEANPFLADLGPVYPAGIEIELPSVDKAPDVPENETVSLWD